MSADATIRLATSVDAARVAALSRDLIEHGLGWSWTPQRVHQSIVDPATNVVIAVSAGARVGFGIMKYRDDDAHLLLLAVATGHARCGFGAGLLGWLEASARAAGLAQVHLEARESNAAARAFYLRLGYRECQVVDGYYQGREASVRMSKDLRVAHPESA